MRPRASGWRSVRITEQDLILAGGRHLALQALGRLRTADARTILARVRDDASAPAADRAFARAAL